MGQRWCILRCAGRSTLPLAASLAEDGFEVWTPVETRIVRIPRANVRREVRRPIMAGFVFACARHLWTLVELADMPVKSRRGVGLRKPAHHDFSLFHDLGDFGFVRDGELQSLRMAEHRAVPLAKLKAYARGATVPGRGAFEGLAGIVEGSRGKFTLVCFNGDTVVKIPTFILRADEIGSDRPNLLAAA